MDAVILPNLRRLTKEPNLDVYLLLVHAVYRDKYTPLESPAGLLCAELPFKLAYISSLADRDWDTTLPELGISFIFQSLKTQQARRKALTNYVLLES